MQRWTFFSVDGKLLQGRNGLCGASARWGRVRTSHAGRGESTVEGEPERGSPGGLGRCQGQDILWWGEHVRRGSSQCPGCRRSFLLHSVSCYAEGKHSPFYPDLMWAPARRRTCGVKSVCNCCRALQFWSIMLLLPLGCGRDINIHLFPRTHSKCTERSPSTLGFSWIK